MDPYTPILNKSLPELWMKDDVVPDIPRVCPRWEILERHRERERFRAKKEGVACLFEEGCFPRTFKGMGSQPQVFQSVKAALVH